jgi:hypothetical protein
MLLPIQMLLNNLYIVDEIEQHQVKHEEATYVNLSDLMLMANMKIKE